MAVTPRQFEEHLDVLAAHRVVPLAELAAGIRTARRGSPAIAITFDDGYADNLDAALPRMEARDIPATFFIATGYVGAGREFWWDELERLLLEPAVGRPAVEVTLDGTPRTWAVTSERERLAALMELQYLLRRMPAPGIDAALGELRDGPALPARRTHAVLDGTGLARLAASPLVEVGGHTRRHGNLARAGLELQREEIAGCAQDLREWLGAPPRGFSYPFGRRGRDFTATAVRVVREAGYSWGVARSGWPLTRMSPVRRLPRQSAPLVGGGDFERWLHERLSP